MRIPVCRPPSITASSRCRAIALLDPPLDVGPNFTRRFRLTYGNINIQTTFNSFPICSRWFIAMIFNDPPKSEAIIVKMKHQICRKTHRGWYSFNGKQYRLWRIDKQFPYSNESWISFQKQIHAFEQYCLNKYLKLYIWITLIPQNESERQKR